MNLVLQVDSGIFGIPCLWVLTLSSGMTPKASASPSRAPVKILVADDHAMIRKIVTTTLAQEKHFEVVGEAENGLDAVRKAEALKPNVVILNVTMPVLDGFEAARQIRKKLPQVAIVILSSNADKRFIEEAKKIGVKAYIPKNEAAVALVRAVEAAIKNEDFYIVE
jgi:DNA-binding NarL/FixJ family response regulator